MNRIYWDRDKISILTDQIESIEHKHYALQLFLSIDKPLNLYVSGKLIAGKCVIVNHNVNHVFSTGNKLHLSIIIEPASNIAKQLEMKMNGNDFRILNDFGIEKIQNIVFELAYCQKDNELNYYQYLIDTLYEYINLDGKIKVYDNRIREVLNYTEKCTCTVHTISFLADMVSLSRSRLSHLFREQVGIPLKSYIQFHQMQKAFFALLSGKTITEAAMLANFDSPSHFAAVTKRMMGMPASLSSKNSVFLKVYDV